jgi:hypothetical protein
VAGLPAALSRYCSAPQPPCSPELEWPASSPNLSFSII